MYEYSIFLLLLPYFLLFHYTTCMPQLRVVLKCAKNTNGYYSHHAEDLYSSVNTNMWILPLPLLIFCDRCINILQFEVPFLIHLFILAESNRVPLTYLSGVEDSDYINAVFVHVRIILHAWCTNHFSCVVHKELHSSLIFIKYSILGISW